MSLEMNFKAYSLIRPNFKVKRFCKSFCW